MAITGVMTQKGESKSNSLGVGDGRGTRDGEMLTDWRAGGAGDGRVVGKRRRPGALFSKEFSRWKGLRV